MTRRFTFLRSALSRGLRRRAILVAATGGLAVSPAMSLAGGRYHDARDPSNDRGERYREASRNEEVRDSKSRVSVEVNIGGQRDLELCRPPVIPVYEERVTRVWVEPVYRPVCDRVWIEPAYRTECDRIWIEPVYRDVARRVWIPDRFEVREVVSGHGRFRRVCTEQVLVEPGHFETRCERIVICEGRWDMVERNALIAPGHWETVSRQELVCAGHWEDRVERIRVEPRRSSGFAFDLFAKVSN